MWLRLILVTLIAFPALAEDPDPEAALSEYRTARRLVAEGSPQAAASLAKVIELDPKGELADDAWVGLADLAGAPRWPEELALVDVETAQTVSELLRRLEEHPRGDRFDEGRYLRGLLALAPAAGQDVLTARTGLVGLVTDADAGRWASRARYALAWFDEISGEAERAEAAYTRLVLDADERETTLRSARGAGRIALRRGSFGDAAFWVERASRLGRDEPIALEIRALAVAAVRGMHRKRSVTEGWRSLQPTTGQTEVRNATDLARSVDGARFLADRRDSQVLRLDADGRVAVRWSVDEPTALAIEPSSNRVFAASNDRILSLEPEGGVTEVARLDTFGSIGGLAIDALGRFWVHDRRGERVARVDPFGTTAVLWEDGDARLGALAFDGVRVRGLDPRNERLLTFDEAGQATSVVLGLRRPADLGIDGAGQIAILDSKDGQVVLYSPAGEERDRIATSTLGVEKPVRIAVGLDGSLDVLDAAGKWVRIR